MMTRVLRWSVLVVLVGCGAATEPALPDFFDAGSSSRVDAGRFDAGAGRSDAGPMRGCSSNAECDDHLACDGTEVCSRGTCMAGAAIMCPSSACTTGICSETAPGRPAACSAAPRDDDHDGFSPISCMGPDCNDSNASVNPAQRENCGNGVDDNCDTFIDCEDPSCAGTPVCSTDCVARATREINCSDGLDDDCNGLTDCNDPRCAGSDACMTLACSPTDLGSMLGRFSGSTVGATDTLMGGCGDASGDRDYFWTAPATGLYTFDTFGSSYDTVLYAMQGSCDAPTLVCNDDVYTGTTSGFSLTMMAGERIVIAVDGFGLDTGAYVLEISAGAREFDCGNGVDDDFDMQVDCADPDCVSVCTGGGGAGGGPGGGSAGGAGGRG